MISWLILLYHIWCDIIVEVWYHSPVYDITHKIMISQTKLWYHSKPYPYITWYRGFITILMSQLWYHTVMSQSVMWYLTKAVISHDPWIQMWPAASGLREEDNSEADDVWRRRFRFCQCSRLGEALHSCSRSRSATVTHSWCQWQLQVRWWFWAWHLDPLVTVICVI